MPAVHEIISTLNQFAQARLPAARWRGGRFDAIRLLSAGWMKPAPPTVSEAPESAYAHAGTEPTLDEVLSDPVVHLIMRADHLQPGELRRLLEDAQRQLASPAAASADSLQWQNQVASTATLRCVEAPRSSRVPLAGACPRR